MSTPRTARRNRRTNETEISVDISLDGSGTSNISTGVGFFDHMLDLFARHALIDLKLEAKGDLHIDAHHTVEDTGITLGLALAEALGDKAGITRYGHFLLPMDEALVQVALDLSGRPFLAIDLPSGLPPIGNFPVQLVEEFFRALSTNAGITLHIRLLAGRNSHHICEAVFKGVARALGAAMQNDPRVDGVPSTKGVL